MYKWNMIRLGEYNEFMSVRVPLLHGMGIIRSVNHWWWRCTNKPTEILASINLMSFFTPGYGLISFLDDIATHQIECNNKSTLSHMKIPPGFPCFMLRTSQAFPKDTDIRVEKLVWLDLPEDLPKFQAFSALVPVMGHGFEMLGAPWTQWISADRGWFFQ